MTTLSREQLTDPQQSGDRPLQVVDPRTNKLYVIVASDVFDRLTSLVTGEVDIRDTYAAQEAALALVWDDPELDIYNVV